MKAGLILLTALFLATPVFAQTYVGDQACSGCHANSPSAGFFDGYMSSGHPWKIFRTMGNIPAPDAWPHTPFPPLPSVSGTQLQWSDVEYVIGNYHWKARFIDRRGYIWTGDSTDVTQWNLQTEEFVPYHAGEIDKPFNCGKCHTTGYDAEGGNQHGLAGLVGTWTEDGVRCEACHGPSSVHVSSGGSTPPPGGKACADCHFRDAEFRMPWSGGFMKHHQQSEDLSHSPHDIFDCESCHNPHFSVVNDEGGTTTTCEGCHPGNAGNNNYVVQGMETVECIDCHMPYMAKSGQKFNAYTGDIRGHLFSIMTDATAAADNVTDGFWNQDGEGNAQITLDYACLGCHIDIGEELTLEEAAMWADSIHTKGVVPVQLALFQVERQGETAMLEWKVTSATNHVGFDVYRQVQGEDRVKLTSSLLSGQDHYTFVDEKARSERADYWLAELSRNGVTTWYGPATLAASSIVPSVSLSPAWPNPFAATANIAYSVPVSQPIRLVIYDTRGRAVKTLVDRVEGPGDHTVTWDGLTDRGVRAAQGIYIVRLSAGRSNKVQKVVYTR